MRKISFIVAIIFASLAWGADISNFASGIENGTTGLNKGDCGSIAASTDKPRTGAQCLSTAYTGGTGLKKWYPDVTFAVPKNSYFHVIGYAKLLSTDGTTPGAGTQAYANAYVGGDKGGDAVNLTTSWQRITASSGKAGSDKTGAKAYFHRKHASKKEVLFDDVIAYVSTQSTVDLTAPSAATSASATETEITWTCGTDGNTGVQATLIWKRTSGTAEDLTLNNQGIYALAATEGPNVDQSGHWELVRVLAADVTSFSAVGSFASNEKYAIVHRDLAYNYSNPTYVTTPDLSVRTLYLKPGTNWKKDGARFSIYCFGGGAEDKWYDMELVDAGCGSGTVYKAEVSKSYTGLKFCRMKGDDPSHGWSDPPLWNQTNDLTMPSTDAAVYEVPDGQWDGGTSSQWRTTPLSICISGSELCFAGEQLTLTATSTGATHYQWYKDGTAISGATTATYINYNFAYENAGNYYCKSRLGTSGTEIQSNTITVKTLRMYFKNGRDGGDYGYVDLRNTDPDHHKATGMIFLGQEWTYGFSIKDGVGHEYGCNNPESSKMWSGDCTNWYMNAPNIKCLMWTENGATYTFTVDYSNFTVPVVSAAYPPDNQAADYKIYFDNSLVNWEEPLYYRVGRGERGSADHTKADLIEKVPGTVNLYQYKTKEYNDLDAWHIADNCGYTGNGYSIYQTNASSEYEIHNAVTYEGGATKQDITIVPIGTHSTGNKSYNDHCEFYDYTMLQGMKTQNVMIDDTENGTITVTYTDVNDASQSFTSGDRDLAHTCILTIETTADCGYQLSSLMVNGSPFTNSDNPYILDTRTTIDAEFEPATYSVTLHPNGGLILAGDVTSYTFGIGATLPTHMSLIGMDFKGWYANSELTGEPVTEISTTDCGDKEYWAKWENEKLKVTYIIGRCQVTGEEWIQGQDGGYSAWLFKGGATPAENTLKATSDIKIPSLNAVNEWFLTKDVTKLPVNSMWSYEKDDATTKTDKSIQAFKVGSSSTVEFDLKELEASSIMFYVFPSSDNAYSVDLKVNGTTTNQPIAGDEQYQIHRFDYFEGPYTGKFSIKSIGKESRVVVIVEVPVVTITFDKNAAEATGTMEALVVPKGTTVTLPENSFAWTDHEFQCWTEGSTTGLEIADEAAYTATANVTLYAKWVEHKETTVTLSAQEADNKDDYTKSVTAVYVKPMPEIAVLPTREWYTFEGYFENPDGTGTQYYSSTGESTHVWDKTTDAIIYAKWTEIKHATITLVATGAYNHYTSSVVATYEKPMPTIPNLPLSETHVFAGYFVNPDGTGTQYYTGTGTSAKDWDQDVSTATLYAKWVEHCDVVPTLTPAASVVTIWNEKKVDLTLVTLSCSIDTTTLKYSYVSASENITGCEYKYFDSRVHIIGTPTGYTTTTNKTITFTFKNNCDPEKSFTVDQTIRIYPTDKKARIALILTGEEKGDFNEYTADDSISCAELIAYLNKKYDVTCVNGYASKKASDLAAYYDQYDLLIVTDFLNTGKGYTNVIGTLIDKKPILSFEAYVANLSNWHIGSNPKDPSPKVQDMKVLCAGHAVFMDAKYDEEDALPVDVVNDADTTVHVLDALSSAKDAKGLQGFTINEAPDFIFLATIRDANNKRDLIVCCERQVVFSARLMLYGINYYEMGNLSKAGRIIIRQMIDYLLMTDETKVADCSLVFDNGAGNPDKSTCGDNLWSNPANWAPGYNIIPTPYQPARIIAECHVNYDAAHAGSVKVNKGRDEHNNPVDGKLIIEPSGGLTIAGVVTTVHDTRYASPITIKAEDLLIMSNETGNGALVYGNKESDVRATVQYYSRGENANVSGKKPVWQYMGIPFQSGQTAIQMYYEAWMCRWATESGLGGLWQWVENEDMLLPFEGYCITQKDKKTYQFAGKLNPPITTTVELDNRDDDGYAFAANSWTAPIKISQMQDADFKNAEKSIYIYHTGTYADWDIKKDEVINTQTSSSSIEPGQYATIPIHSSPYIGVDSVIPSMQGFFVRVLDKSKEANIKLVYNRTVYDATYFKTSTQPMRAPRRLPTEEPDVMQLMVSGDNYGDRVYLLARNDFSEEFEDGWDGRKIAGDEDAPMLSVMKEAGEMAVAAIETADERELLFRAGEDTEYTFSFAYEGERIYLYDRLAGKATEIKTGNTYSFTADNETAMPRFLITKNPPQVPTDIEQLDNGQWTMDNARKLIIDGVLYILRDNRFYDARGVRVTELRRKEVTP
ncbi:MAG: InlB B-repeat-containing protein [Paludibacteraceae bacterium]|nr:InlB B-repeat-containing protein [Paludibacteraceae bacterium]